VAQADGVPAAFHAFAHDDVVLFRPGHEPYRGKEGVRARFADWPAGGKLIWAPDAAEISARGDMGWTWGRGVFVLPGAEPSPSLYVSVWRRDLDGAWRYVTDIGITGPKPSAPGVSPDLRR
jgi:ketosteroid isomerase-like protein